METRSQETKPFRVGWENHLCHWAGAMTACMSPDLPYWALSLILCVIWVKWFCFFGSWFLIITSIINLIVRPQKKSLTNFCKYM